MRNNAKHERDELSTTAVVGESRAEKRHRIDTWLTAVREGNVGLLREQAHMWKGEEQSRLADAAVQSGQLRVLKFLGKLLIKSCNIHQHCDIHKNNERILNRLLRTALLGDNVRIVIWLLKQLSGGYADVTPLQMAVELTNLPAVRFLVQHGVDIHENEDIALRIALMSLSADIFESQFTINKTRNIVNYLVEHGAKLQPGGSDIGLLETNMQELLRFFPPSHRHRLALYSIATSHHRLHDEDLIRQVFLDENSDPNVESHLL